LSESLLLDWIEGRLSDADGRALAAAAGRPEIATLVAQMQASRRTLRAMAWDEAAPPVLLARVLAATGSSSTGSANVSATRPTPPPYSFIEAQAQRRRTSEHRARLTRFALAAGIAILAGGGIFLMWSATAGNGSAAPGPVDQMRVALEPSNDKNALIPGSNELSRENTAAANAKINGTSNQNTQPEPRYADLPNIRATDHDDAVVADTHPTTSDSFGPPAPATSTSSTSSTSSPSYAAKEVYGTRLVFDPQEALVLAREGRLLMRVGATSGRALPQLDSLVAWNDAWQVSDDVSQSLVEAVRPYFILADENAPSTTGDADGSGGRNNWASEQPDSIIGPPSPDFDNEPRVRMAQALARPDSTTYVVEVNNDAEALDDLKTKAGRSFEASVLYEEMQSPAPSHSKKKQRLSVPVIVERR